VDAKIVKRKTPPIKGTTWGTAPIGYQTDNLKVQPEMEGGGTLSHRPPYRKVCRFDEEARQSCETAGRNWGTGKARDREGLVEKKSRPKILEKFEMNQSTAIF